MPGAPSIWVVVTCMGRLQFLKQTVPTVLSQPGLRYCLVDYSCPDHAGAWLGAEHRQAIEQGRAAVVLVKGKTFFEKSKALNAGGRLAVERGADYLCFLDGDTILRPGCGDWLSQQVSPDRFIIAGQSPVGRDLSCLMGLMVMPAAKFTATGGYDEGMVGWGGEDVEMRFRLYIKEGLRYRRMPVNFLDYIDHDDALREKNHILSKMESGKRNLERAYARVAEWTSGRQLHELGPEARLLCRWRPRPGPPSPPPSPPAKPQAR